MARTGGRLTDDEVGPTRHHGLPGLNPWPSFDRIIWLTELLAGTVLCLAILAQLPATAGEYLLGPQDKVRLKIYEWRPSRDEIFEWKALNDEFTVGAGGALSLPFAGDIDALGATPSELAVRIGQSLMERMGLGRRPDVAVEVVQFRPFYIVGQVMQSGEFPYRPGLTVLKAISIAGGLRRRADDALSRIDRELITGQGDLDLLNVTQPSLLARKARLEAELAGAASIEFPVQLTDRMNDSTIAMMMEQERSIFAARREGFETQERALTELKEFLEKEAATLEQQLSFYDTQIALVQKELDSVSVLVDKGLTAQPREIALQRDLAQVQSSRLTAETAMLRAKQEVSKTDISILELRNRQANETTTALRETQMQLNEAAHKAETTNLLLRDSEVTGVRLFALQSQGAKVEPIYTILRPTKDGKVELVATESTEVEPGDTVKVEIPLPAWLQSKRDPGGLSFQSSAGQTPGPVVEGPAADAAGAIGTQ